jgi:hypothetical protein
LPQHILSRRLRSARSRNRNCSPKYAPPHLMPA